MIGIGNKPYIRGEGPGLSWEEGICHEFRGNRKMGLVSIQKECLFNHTNL